MYAYEWYILRSFTQSSLLSCCLLVSFVEAGLGFYSEVYLLVARTGETSERDEEESSFFLDPFHARPISLNHCSFPMFGPKPHDIVLALILDVFKTSRRLQKGMSVR